MLTDLLELASLLRVRMAQQKSAPEGAFLLDALAERVSASTPSNHVRYYLTSIH